MLEKFDHLQLPGKNSRLPARYCDLLGYYDDLINSKGETNIAVENAVQTLVRAPLPPGVPAVAAPAWVPLARIAGHLAAVCSFGIMHPTTRELTGYRWTRRHDVEFRILSSVIPIAYSRLPGRLTMSPMAYHKALYEKHIAKCRAAGLESFTPDPH